MGDALAARIARTLKFLAGVEETELPKPARMDEIVTLAAERLDCLEPDREVGLGQLRRHAKLQLRRALFMAAAAYRRQVAPPPLSLAEHIARTEKEGLRSVVVFGGVPGLAVQLARTTGQRVAFVPDESADPSEAELAELEQSNVLVAESLPAGGELPFFLRERFQTAVVHPPMDAIAGRKSLSRAIASLQPAPGRRLYWLGHAARQDDYFGLYSLLGRRGFFLERLSPDVLELPLETGLAEALLSGSPEGLGGSGIPGGGLLEDLLASGHEYEHLHLFRPVEEVALRGQQLDMVPLQEKDVPLFDSWLTPELTAEMSLEDDRPRTSVEAAQAPLRLPNWYPSSEWWMLRTKEGRGVGVVKMVLTDLWARRVLTWDIALVDRSLRGHGLLDDIFRLGFHRHFEQLRSEELWADISSTNVRLLAGARKNFCTWLWTYNAQSTGAVFEHFHIPAEVYWQKRASGEITCPEEA